MKLIEIDCFQLNTILDKYNIKKIDYLNIDTEGNDFKVISTFNFTKFNPTLISIEYNDYDINNLLNSEINKLMNINDYKIVSKFGVTCFYTKNTTLLEFEEIMKI